MSAWIVPGYPGSRELGSGASGRVVLAVHQATGTPVAVRYLAEELRSDTGFAEDFPGEARALSRLDSPYVVRVRDLVVADEDAALVTELVRGVALDAVLRGAGDGLGPEAALVVLRDALLGLAEGHRAGVTHRCVRPSNVLVTAEGAVKVADFGLAPRKRGAPVDRRAAGYRSPEQWGGEPASAAGDVYALTAVFFECLTGRRPFPGDDPAEVSVQHILTPVPEEDVPEAVRELVRAGLAKDPGRRPEDAAQFAADVAAVAERAYGPDWEERGRRRLAAGAAALRQQFPPAVAEPSAGPVVSVAPGGEGHGGRGLRRGWLAGAAALLVAAGTAAAVTALGGDEESGISRAARESTRAPQTVTPSAGTEEAAAQDGPPTSSRTPDRRTPDTPGPSSPTVSDTGRLAGVDERHSDRSATASRGPTAAAESSPSADAGVTARIRELRDTGLARATATIEVTARTTEPVTVTVTWHRSGDRGEVGEQDGDAETFELSGDTRYELTADHRFRGLACYWTVRVVTAPATHGAAVEQVEAPLCL